MPRRHQRQFSIQSIFRFTIVAVFICMSYQAQITLAETKVMDFVVVAVVDPKIATESPTTSITTTTTESSTTENNVTPDSQEPNRVRHRIRRLRTKAHLDHTETLSADITTESSTMEIPTIPKVESTTTHPTTTQPTTAQPITTQPTAKQSLTSPSTPTPAVVEEPINPKMLAFLREKERFNKAQDSATTPAPVEEPMSPFMLEFEREKERFEKANEAKRKLKETEKTVIIKEEMKPDAVVVEGNSKSRAWKREMEDTRYDGSIFAAYMKALMNLLTLSLRVIL